MGALSIWHILIIVGLLFLLFARPGRISGMMEDLGKGIKGFRRGLGDNTGTPAPPTEPPRQVPDQTASTQTSASDQDRAQS